MSIAIANRLSKTEDGLEGIKGIGRRKTVDYWRAVLKMVNGK
ncbi:MAG: hypothetical protein U9N41_07625 [Euryarchaeota archaeon]|nr:hypothetical protein [Euryarchaeota archaeon]